MFLHISEFLLSKLSGTKKNFGWDSTITFLLAYYLDKIKSTFLDNEEKSHYLNLNFFFFFKDILLLVYLSDSGHEWSVIVLDVCFKMPHILCLCY